MTLNQHVHMVLSRWPVNVFVHFSSTPNSIFNRSISSESQSYTEFNDILSARKYCQLFTHESNTFLTSFRPFKRMRAQMPNNARYHARNSPFPFDDHHQNLIHPCQARPHSPAQTASGSNQPFCHSSHVRADRWDGMFSNISALLAMLIQSDAVIK